MQKKVCVIGAGASGLCAAKNLLDVGIVPVILERSPYIGGTWVFDEQTGYDKYGLPIHTSMYKSLRTNLPKEVMGFPDFPIPEYDKSYLPAKDILSFLQSYSDSFNITRYIKFECYVKTVKRCESAWNIYYTNLSTGNDFHEEFDAVMICNGHYNTPYQPNINGLQKFKGDIIHSHDYRSPENFKGKSVLVIGAGPSGMDIASEISTFTNKTFLSHHSKENLKFDSSKGIKQKPDIKNIEGHTITFVDNTNEDIDLILFCTGYVYSYPFLDPSCKIFVDQNYVQPLYKHLINIEYPTMCLIGIPFYVCAFSMFDLQARYFVKLLQGKFRLPSKETMFEAMKTDFEDRTERGLSKRQAHMMGPIQNKYFTSLSDEADLTPLPAVLEKMHTQSSRMFIEDISNFRNYKFKTIDEGNFHVLSLN